MAWASGDWCTHTAWRPERKAKKETLKCGRVLIEASGRDSGNIGALPRHRSRLDVIQQACRHAILHPTATVGQRRCSRAPMSIHNKTIETWLIHHALTPDSQEGGLGSLRSTRAVMLPSQMLCSQLDLTKMLDCKTRQRSSTIRSQ